MPTLDALGTAVAAITLGPGWGVVVAVLRHGVGMVTGQPETTACAAVSVVAALLWGFGVRQWGMGRTVARMDVTRLRAGPARSSRCRPTR